ncbi:MAG TPA: hypothetical protein VFG87_05865 [Amycolatopsis sp.]|nr:hypothetical protein [Amycolatopsis sp.]
MRGRTRRTAAVGTAAFILAGSAAITGASGTASADTITAQCGQTVTAKPGDTISTPFGLQTVTGGVTSLLSGLLGGLCQITVNVVDTVVAPVPVAGQPVAGAVDGAVGATANTATKAVTGAGEALAGPSPAPPTPPGGGTPPQPGGGKAGGSPSAGGAPTIPAPTSPILTPVPLPFDTTGYAPMRDYSGIPAVLPAFWAPSPVIQYGGEIPGYAPEPGTLSTGRTDDSGSQDIAPVQNAGHAEALPDAPDPASFPLGLPALLAVLALSGVTAALVRRWVLRGTH